MTADERRHEPWEEQEPELTEEEVKQQLARMLAVGALQRVRAAGFAVDESREGDGEEASADE